MFLCIVLYIYMKKCFQNIFHNNIPSGLIELHKLDTYAIVVDDFGSFMRPCSVFQLYEIYVCMNITQTKAVMHLNMKDGLLSSVHHNQNYKHKYRARMQWYTCKQKALQHIAPLATAAWPGGSSQLECGIYQPWLKFDIFASVQHVRKLVMGQII